MIHSLLHAKDDDVVVLAHLRFPQVLAGEGGGGGEAEPPRPPLGVEHEPRVELHSVGPVPGLGGLQNDPAVAGPEIESGNSFYIIFKKWRMNDEPDVNQPPSPLCRDAATAATERPHDVGHLRVGGGDVGQAYLPERGRDEGEADGADGDGHAT